MLFVYDFPEGDASFDMEQHVAELQRYDSWSVNDFNEHLSKRDVSRRPTPVAFFNIDDQW